MQCYHIQEPVFENSPVFRMEILDFEGKFDTSFDGQHWPPPVWTTLSQTAWWDSLSLSDSETVIRSELLTTDELTTAGVVNKMMV